MSKLEDMIDQIEEYVNSCKPSKLSKGHIVAEKSVLEDMIRELRLSTPDEVTKYQTVINNKEAILSDARQKAHALINEAEEHRNELINEHEVMRQAYEQANDVVKNAAEKAQELLDRAQTEANGMKELAVNYTDQLLAQAEELIQKAIDLNTRHSNELISEMTTLCETVRSNRTALTPPEAEEAYPETEALFPEPEEAALFSMEEALSAETENGEPDEDADGENGAGAASAPEADDPLVIRPEGTPD